MNICIISMSDFDSKKEVIIERTNPDGSEHRRFTFGAGRFNTIDDVKEYLRENHPKTKTYEYDIRQPIDNFTLNAVKEYPYTETEEKWITDAIQSFQTTPGVIQTTRMDESPHVQQVKRPPYNLEISQETVDFSVTVDGSQYEYTAVETDLMTQITTTAQIFYEGKLQNYSRGDTTPESYTVYFSMERKQGNTTECRAVYHKLRAYLNQHGSELECFIAGDLATGTTHSYVLGDSYPDSAILISVRSFDTEEETFFTDVIFTTELTEKEAFTQIESKLSSYTAETKEMFTTEIQPFIESTQFSISTIGAGEYANGSVNQLLLGIQPDK